MAAFSHKAQPSRRAIDAALQSLPANAILKCSDRGRFVRYKARTNESIVGGNTMSDRLEGTSIPDDWATVTLPPGFDGTRRRVNLRSSPNMLIFGDDLPATSAILRQYALSAQCGGHEIWLLNHRGLDQPNLAGVENSHFTLVGDLDAAGFALVAASLTQNWDEVSPALTPISVIIENALSICCDEDLILILDWLAAHGADVGIHFAITLPTSGDNGVGLTDAGFLARFTTKVRVLDDPTSTYCPSEMKPVFGRRGSEAATVANNASRATNRHSLAIYSKVGGPIAIVKVDASESIWRTCRADLKSRIQDF
jgi:hypothetical protein